MKIPQKPDYKARQQIQNMRKS